MLDLHLHLVEVAALVKEIGEEASPHAGTPFHGFMSPGMNPAFHSFLAQGSRQLGVRLLAAAASRCSRGLHWRALNVRTQGWQWLTACHEPMKWCT